jgi:hypothetical protein
MPQLDQDISPRAHVECIQGEEVAPVGPVLHSTITASIDKTSEVLVMSH